MGFKPGQGASLYPQPVRNHATCGHIGRPATALAAWSALQKGRQYGS